MAVGGGPGVNNDTTNNTTKMLGGTAIKPIERHGMEAIRWFLYDSNTGAVMGRTPKSWALITLFYIIYYSFLAAFWIAMLLIFFQTIDNSAPKWINSDGIIGTSPGLGLRPKQTDEFIDSSMIIFNRESQEDVGSVPGWFGWANRTKDFLNTYNNDTGYRCIPGKSEPTKDKACNFDAERNLGPCFRGNHGYDEGKPCIFLKLNKIYGLKNTALTNYPQDIPKELKQHIEKQANKNMTWIHCRGENAADLESMGSIKYYPETRGLPDEYFPYLAQKEYQSPVVAVQFLDPKIGQLLHIECRAWAQNIQYNRMERIGIAHLELLVLDNEHANAIRKAEM